MVRYSEILQPGHRISVVNELAMGELLEWIVRRLPGLSKEEKDK